MRSTAIRVAACSAAIATFAVFGAACSSNKSNETSSSAASATSSATSGMATTSAGASATTPDTGAPTTIPGANGTPYTVQGPILAKYKTLTADQLKDLGKPYDNEQKTKDGTGVYQQFDGGVLIYRNGGPVYFVWGKIRDAWNANQASQGKLGYPTSDEQVLPDGSFKSVFEHGTVTWKTGDADATVTMS